mgnify:CR=1 FL=1
MKILIIAQYYRPDITAAAFRIAETAELLAQGGHAVTVITAEPHRTQAKDSSNGLHLPDSSGAAKQPDQPQQPRVVRVPIEPFSTGGMKAYLRHYFSFVMRARRRVAELIGDGYAPDAVWTSSPPLFVGLIGTKAAQKAKAPMVLDVRDVWPDTAVAAGQLSESGMGYRLGKVLERYLYRRAAAITCVAQPMAEYVRRETSRTRAGLSTEEKRITVVYNGAGSQPAVATSPEQASEPDPEQVIVYAGNLGRLQGIDSLLRAWAQSDTAQDLGWRVEIIGDGVLAPELKELTETLGISETVQFRGVVSKEESVKATTRAGILFLNLLPNAVFDLTIPSKLFDYLATGRPIIGGIRGEGRSLLRELPGNATPAPSDVQEIAEAITTLVSSQDWSAPRAKNIAVAGERFSRSRNTERLEKLLHAVSGHSINN